MAAAHARANGANGLNGLSASFPPARYSKVPPTITVAVAEADGPIDVEIALDDDIQDDPTELCTLLENEHSAKTTWVTVAIAYAKHKKLDVAIEVLTKSNAVFARGRAEDRLSILNGLCWLYLLKCREAPRMIIGMCNSTISAKLMRLIISRWPAKPRVPHQRLLHPSSDQRAKRCLPNQSLVPSALPRPRRPLPSALLAPSAHDLSWNKSNEL